MSLSLMKVQNDIYLVYFLHLRALYRVWHTLGTQLLNSLNEYLRSVRCTHCKKLAVAFIDTESYSFEVIL